MNQINKYKGYRNMFNLMQKEVAEYLGISRDTYCKKEKAQSFNINEKRSLAAKYGIEISDLEARNENMH